MCVCVSVCVCVGWGGRGGLLHAGRTLHSSCSWSVYLSNLTVCFPLFSCCPFSGPQGSGEPVLVARTAMCADGMDMALYEQALDVRRRYLREWPYDS